jgi:lincosamide nucleotidyltransferase B/F
MKQLQRFQEIISRNQSEDVLAFLGLGSMHDLSRIDNYSDIDFFMIVEKGHKLKYLQNVKWLEVAPIVFWYRETKDGLKVIYDDGILLEFVVFEVDELKSIPFQEGTVYYSKPTFDTNILIPSVKPPKKQDETWILNTLLGNLYVGLLREHRGEHVAAFLMIQVYAAHHLLTLLDTKQDDPFVVERRIESRLTLDYQSIYPGIEYNKEAARHILNIACRHQNCSVDFEIMIKEFT